MQLKINIKNKSPFIVALGLSIILVSCGSYQYVGYDNDGIYSDVPSTQRIYTETSEVEVVDSDAGYYKNYFQERSRELEVATSGSDTFTDADSYRSDYTEEQDSTAYRTSYSGWGQTNDNVNINIYNTGWNNWGWNNWGWDPFWGSNYYRVGYGYNWGFPGYGWNSGWGWPGYGWGWNNWGWNAGWGYGGLAFGYGGYWGSGYGWNLGYGAYHPYNRNVAYAGSRRGDAFLTNNLGRNSSLNRTSSNLGRRTSTLSRSNSELRRTVERNNARRTDNSRLSTRNSINSRNIRYTPNTRVNPNSRTIRNNNSTRVNTRTSRPTTTRSSTPTRSSGGTISSGGSRGSSGGGGRSSGGGRRGG